MATKYVKSSATGSGDGSLGNPWTLAQATAAAALAAGDTLVICADATYSNTAAVSWTNNSGTQSAPITVVGANASGTIDGTKPTISNTTNSANQHCFVSGTFYVFRYIEARIANFGSVLFNGFGRTKFLDCSNNSGSGGFICFTNCADCVMRRFTTGAMLSLLNNCTRVKFVESYVYGGSTSDVVGATVTQFSFVNCVVNPGSSRLANSADVFATGSIFTVKCTINVGTMNATRCVFNGGLAINDGASSSGAKVERSIIYNAAAYGISVGTTAAFIIEEYNTFYNNTSGDLSTGAAIDSTSVNRDPKLQGSGNYSLLSTSSDRNEAVAFGDGVNISYLDRGAIQHQPGGLLRHPGMMGGINA